jgi:hypothetical protein
MSKEMDINKELEETLTKALHEERMKAYQPVRDLLDKYNISPDDRVKDMINSLDCDLTFKIKDYQSHSPIKAPLSN